MARSNRFRDGTITENLRGFGESWPHAGRAYGSGWVKLYRDLLGTGMMQNPKLFTFFAYCLLKASHQEHVQVVGFRSIILRPGQFVFGRKVAAQDLNMTESSIRYCLDSLQTSGKIAIKTTNKYSIITLLDWALNQGGAAEDNQQNSQQMANNPPTSSHKQECEEGGERKRKSPSHSDEEGSGVENDERSRSYLTKRGRKLRDQSLADFHTFWEKFDYKRGKADAADAWLDEYSVDLFPAIIAGAEREARRRPDLQAKGRTPKMAQGWLSGRRWEDCLEADPQPEIPVADCGTCQLKGLSPQRCWERREKFCEYYRRRV